MIDAIFSGFYALSEGLRALVSGGMWPNVAMLVGAGLLLWLGVVKKVEPLLLVPIGFGCFLVNLPLSGVMEEHGILRVFYEAGILNELFPLLIFIGIGAMTDFTPLLANPKILLFGAAGQLGIFLTVGLALWAGFDHKEAVSIGMIGACDGPTVIFVSSQFAPHLLAATSVAAYSYMSLVPILQPPIMRLMTTQEERRIRMPNPKGKVSKTALVLFPLIVTGVTGLIAPQGLPLMGMIMLGNFLKTSGAVQRLTHASENEIASVCTLFLGLAIGGTMAGPSFLKAQTLLILGLGLLAIIVDTVGGLLLGKLMCKLSGGKINPLVGAAGISAYPMAARIVQQEGQREDKHNYLLMHAMGANTGGQIGSIMAAAIMLSVLKGLGIVG